jgi:hypothetical protein
MHNRELLKLYQAVALASDRRGQRISVDQRHLVAARVHVTLLRPGFPLVTLPQLKRGIEPRVTGSARLPTPQEGE